MAIGERIRFFRNLRGMTQKYLGTVVGFPEKTADIRMAQYESGIHRKNQAKRAAWRTQTIIKQFWRRSRVYQGIRPACGIRT